MQKNKIIVVEEQTEYSIIKTSLGYKHDISLGYKHGFLAKKHIIDTIEIEEK